MNSLLDTPASATLPRLRVGTDWIRLLAVSAVLVAIAVITFVPSSTNDFWLQAKIGEMVWQTHQVPTTVLFPFTPIRDATFNAHEWLPSILFHLLDRGLGHDGLTAVLGALGMALFALSWRLAYRLSGSVAVSLLLAAMAMVVANYRHHLRPEIFALLLFVGLLNLLHAFRRTGRWRNLIASLPLMLIWANTHGSFPLAPVTVLLFGAAAALDELLASTVPHWRQRLRPAARAAAPYAALAVAQLATALLNPQGWGLLVFAFTFSQSDLARAVVSEWQPTFSGFFMELGAFWIYVACVSLTAIVMLRWRRHVTPLDLLLIGAFGFLSASRCRFVVLFGFVAMAVMARVIGAAGVPARAERLLRTLALALGVAGTALALRFGNVYHAYAFMAPSDDFTEPMKERLMSPSMRGNVINSYNLGAELIYCCYPRLRPWLDSRIDSYGAPYFATTENIMAHEALLLQFVDDYRVDYLLLTRRDFSTVQKMEQLRRSGWRIAFADHKAVLIERIRKVGTQTP
jgi:hypothetical protein